MRMLKNLAWFAAGGATIIGLMAVAMVDGTDHPKQGAIMYDDDDIRITDISSNPADGGRIHLATIVRKDRW